MLSGEIALKNNHYYYYYYSLTGTSGSNAMVHIEVNNKINVSCIEFQKKMTF